jgi:predicted nucleotidyltransferase
MEVNQIKEMVFNDNKYRFLFENQHLKGNIILLVLGGSYAYGTNNKNSDVDIRGIALERETDLLGLTNFEQRVDEKTDTTIFGLRKAVSLMSNCNPNMIEMLGCKPEHYIILTKEGQLLLDNVDLFLSQKAKYTFGGYATAQLRRLRNALARNSCLQTEKEQHILKSIEKQMYYIKEHYTKIANGKLNLYIDKSEKEDYDTEIFMDIELKHYPLRDFKNIYSEFSSIVKGYSKLTQRNKKKTEEGLNKHAMHLIRLLIMGTEILEGKGIHTFREKEHDLLIDIRNGKYTYEEIFEMADELEKKFEYASKNSPLPKKPDFNKINELVIEINRSVIS